jgi:predicted nucleic acid-binding protein
VIHLDTSVLVASLAGARPAAAALRAALEAGERVQLSTLVLYEWLRGPRSPEELEAQELLFPRESAVPFGPTEAALASDLYRALRRPRARATDLSVAACAIVHGAALWTLDPEDLDDVPGLRLYRAS